MRLATGIMILVGAIVTVYTIKVIYDIVNSLFRPVTVSVMRYRAAQMDDTASTDVGSGEDIETLDLTTLPESVENERGEVVYDENADSKKSKIEQKYYDAIKAFISDKGYNLRIISQLRDPALIVNPLTGRPLEIDIFIQGIDLGIEINGFLHYTDPAQIERDNHKYSSNISIIAIDAKMEFSTNMSKITRVIDTIYKMHQNKNGHERN